MMYHTMLRRLKTCMAVVASGERTQPRSTWRISSAAALCTSVVVMPTAAYVEYARRRVGRSAGETYSSSACAGPAEGRMAESFPAMNVGRYCASGCVAGAGVAPERWAYVRRRTKPQARAERMLYATR